MDELVVTRGGLTDNFHSYVNTREWVGAQGKSNTMHVGADTRGEQWSSVSFYSSACYAG